MTDKYLKGQNKFILLAISISILGLILFLMLSSALPFKRGLFSLLYPKSASLADEITGDFKWDNFPIRYYISTQNLPSGITGDDLKNATERAFGNWLKYPGIAASAEFLQFIDANPNLTQADGKTIIGFQAFSGGMGATQKWGNSTTKIISEADVVIDTNELWTNAYEPGKMSLESVLTHEIGHLFGLKGTYDDLEVGLTMYEIFTRGLNVLVSTPEEKEISILQAIYPKSPSMPSENRIPTLNPVPAFLEVIEGENLKFDLTGTDPDGNTLTFYALNLPKEFGTINGAEVTLSPNLGHVGIYKDVTFGVSDGYLYSEQRVQILVKKFIAGPFIAQYETTPFGTRSQGMTMAGINVRGDNLTEQIQEVVDGSGKNATSKLIHKWRFDNVDEFSSICADAKLTVVSTESEFFKFSYSTSENGTYTDFYFVNNSKYGIQPTCVPLPAAVMGTVWVKTEDNDRSSRKTVLDAVEVDLLRIVKTNEPLRIELFNAAVLNAHSVRVTWVTDRPASSNLIYGNFLINANPTMVQTHDITLNNLPTGPLSLQAWSQDADGIVGYSEPKAVYLGRLISMSDTPDPFSPNGDGKDDLTTITVNLRPDGYLKTIYIFDYDELHKYRNYALSFKILREISPPSGQEYFNQPIAQWDGKGDDGVLLPPGTYYYVPVVDGRSGNQWLNQKEWDDFGSVHLIEPPATPPTILSFEGPTDINLGIDFWHDVAAFRYRARHPDPGCHDLKFYTDFGDGKGYVWDAGKSYVCNGEIAETWGYEHVWTQEGTFYPKSYMVDENGKMSDSIPLSTYFPNLKERRNYVIIRPVGWTDRAPGAPSISASKIWGYPWVGWVNACFFDSTDEQSPWLQYRVNWGDGTSSGAGRWTNCQTHRYPATNKNVRYTIEAWTVDPHGTWSKRSSTYTITINLSDWQ